MTFIISITGIHKVLYQAPIEKAGGCLHVHCTKSDKNLLPKTLNGKSALISGAGRTCAGTVWKSIRRDLRSTAISAAPEGFDKAFPLSTSFQIS